MLQSLATLHTADLLQVRDVLTGPLGFELQVFPSKVADASLPGLTVALGQHAPTSFLPQWTQQLRHFQGHIPKLHRTPQGPAWHQTREPAQRTLSATRSTSGTSLTGHSFRRLLPTIAELHGADSVQLAR